MADLSLILHRDTNGPSPVLRLPGDDLTGKTVELVLTPPDGQRRVLSTATGELTPVGADGLPVSPGEEPFGFAVRYDEEFVRTLPLGRLTKADLFVETPGGERSKLGAGTVTVGGTGQYLGATLNLSVTLPGLQGPPGLNPRGTWAPGAYAERDMVTHAGGVWYALADTSAEPSIASPDWSLLIDGTGAAAALAEAQQILAASTGRLDFSNSYQSGWL